MFHRQNQFSKMGAFVLFLLYTISLFFFTSTDTYACTQPPPPETPYPTQTPYPLSVRIENADFAFKGTLEQITDADWPNTPYLFSIDTLYKGELIGDSENNNWVTIHGFGYSSFCMPSLSRNQEYLILGSITNEGDYKYTYYSYNAEELDDVLTGTPAPTPTSPVATLSCADLQSKPLADAFAEADFVFFGENTYTGESELDQYSFEYDFYPEDIRKGYTIFGSPEEYDNPFFGIVSALGCLEEEKEYYIFSSFFDDNTAELISYAPADEVDDTWVQQLQQLDDTILDEDITITDDQELLTFFENITPEEQAAVKSLLLYNLSVTSLPTGVWELSNLESLWIIQLHNLIEIPEEIGDLSNLRRLSIRASMEITEIPATIGNLIELEIVEFGHNNVDTGFTIPTVIDVHELPIEFCNLTNLHYFSTVNREHDLPLTRCNEFTPYLPNLQSPNCDSEWTLIDVVLLKRLDSLTLTMSSECANDNQSVFANSCDINRDNQCGLIDAVIVQQCDAGVNNPYCELMQ